MAIERVAARVGGTLAGAAAVVVVMLIAGTGDSSLGAVPLLVLGLVVVLGPALAARIPRKAVADRWTPVPAFQPGAPHEPAAGGRVAAALAGAESRELGLASSFGAGLALCLTFVVLFGFVWPEDSGGYIAEVVELLPVFVHPLVGMVVLGAHRARTRSRRDGTEELFAACPASQATRTAGHLASGWLPVAVVFVFAVAMPLLVRANASPAWGPFGVRQVVTIVGACVLAAGGTALGVALARWTPWTIAPVAAVVAVGFGAAHLATVGANTSEPVRQLSTFLGDPEVDLRFTAPHYLARLGWLVALVAIVAVLAILKDRVSPPLVAGGVLAIVAAGLFAVAATRPIQPADAQRIAAVLNDLPAHQECLDANGVPVCAFPGDEALARHLVSHVASVAAAAPAEALEGYSVRSAATVDRYDLDPAIFRLTERERGPGILPAEIQVHREAEQGVRLWVALAAVGVVDDRRPNTVLDIADQARGVLALWLATRGAPAAFVDDMTSFDRDVDAAAISSRPWPDECYAGNTPVTWAVADVSAARLLLRVPEATVAATVTAEWDRFTDPGTSTAELLAAFGLDPTAPATERTRTGGC